ncbi:enoyl-CoA hydratase [Aurantiacibacter sediminis]|uniref:Enoyl-CoA hydratase n=1 Tax=Aurantiacibacter sediminis TaxID=2793064 RepID=A0ABS0N148_9SPHN|nr:enoyl-CoA hydratase [Aurantiacibacter sediminis]MBH5321676.1 enoyl-CoA hydratase [Aurantiacibacter sediminis]
MSEHTSITQDGGILTLTMNRPDKKNALTDAMYGAMADAIEGAQDDKAVRVIVIRGHGEMFCAGNDIGDFMVAASGGDITRANVFRFIRLLGTSTKPLVAGVQGRAVGIGTTMLLHCDYVVLADDAKLTAPFATLGLVPEAASSKLLPSAIGHQRAFAMMAMGEAIAAEEALASGLANAIVPVEGLNDAVGDAAQRIAALPPGAVQASKALMRDRETIAETMETEIAIFAQRLQSEEAREAFTAFMQKRAPDFSRS